MPIQQEDCVEKETRLNYNYGITFNSYERSNTDRRESVVVW